VAALQLLDVQRLVGDDHEPGEGARKGGLGQRAHRVLALVLVLALVDILAAHFDSRLGQALDQLLGVDAKELGNCFQLGGAFWLGLEFVMNYLLIIITSTYTQIYNNIILLIFKT